MNILLRSKILEQSLQIEHNIANILAHVIRVEKEGSKTLSNKSSSIPFKVKVDFLYDLKRISKDDYNFLILFMEIRNQLMHNLEMDTLGKIIPTIEKKSLFFNLNPQLKFYYDKEVDIEEKEQILELLLDKLYINIIDILQQQMQLIVADRENEARSLKDKIYKDLFDILIESHKEVVQKFSNAFTDDDVEREELKILLIGLLNKEFKDRMEIKFGIINEDHLE